MGTEGKLIDWVSKARFEDFSQGSLGTVKNQFLTIVGTTVAGATEAGCLEAIELLPRVRRKGRGYDTRARG